MHYITLDTNTWIYLANGTEPVRLLHFIKQEVDKGNIKIILPQIIIDEWNKNKENAVIKGSLKHFKEITSALERLSQLLGDKGKKDALSFLFEEKDDNDYFEDIIENFKKKKTEIKEAISDNINLIDDLFKHRSTIVLEIKSEVILKSGQFALEKKAPFKEKNSFADALIVFSFLDYVKACSIEGAIFISYNTDDFCEKKDNKKYLHPDIDPDFKDTKSHFYKIVGEALNTIKEDIVSKEELELIQSIQDEEEYEEDIIYCEDCLKNHNKANEIFFATHTLIDNRIGINNMDPMQIKLDFAKDLPGINEEKYNEIEIGYCSWCSIESFKCVTCKVVNSFFEDDYNTRKECDGCGFPYFIDTSNPRKRNRYSILNDICSKCGNEYENDRSDNNICQNCENEYSYGD